MQRFCLMLAATLWTGWGASLPVLSWAGDPLGPRGSLGPRGDIGPSRPQDGSAGQVGAVRRPAPVEPRNAPKREGMGNRVEATGNSAAATICGATDTSVNSVDVRGARLEGRTVIVQGRNSRHVDTRDCPPTAAPGEALGAPSQVNSIRIR